MLLEEGTAFSTGRHRGVLLGDRAFSGLSDRGGDRLDTGGGEDVSGFGRSGRLGLLKSSDLGVGFFELRGELSQGGFLGGEFDLHGVEFSGDVNDRGFDSLTQIVALGGQGQDGGLSGLGAFFDGHILLRLG